MKAYNIAIVGATGLVGQELTKILEQRRFPASSLHLFASDRSAGKKLFVNHREVEVKEVNHSSFEHIDIAFFSASDEVSLYYSPIAVHAGAVVIDSSTAFWQESDVPLVVPEVNPEDIKGHKGIIANPGSPAIQLAVALHPLQKANPIKKMIAVTYQAVSGTGTAAMEELTSQTRLVAEGHNVVPHVYSHQIAFNLLPEIGVFLDNGYTKEEWKLIKELGKIMHAEDTAISATCVRVPVYIGHSIAVHLEFSHTITPDEARRILAESAGIKVQDDPAISLYPQPWSVAGSDEVFVGRIRQDVAHSYGLAMWVVADNIRKGAALNAVQIAELMVHRNWI